MFINKITKVVITTAVIFTASNSFSTEVSVEENNYTSQIFNSVCSVAGTLSEQLREVRTGITALNNGVEKVEKFQEDLNLLNPDIRTNTVLKYCVMKNAAIGFSAGLVIPAILYAADSSPLTCVVAGVVSTSGTSLSGAAYGFFSHFKNAYNINKNNLEDCLKFANAYTNEYLAFDIFENMKKVI